MTETALQIDFPVMLSVAVACLPIFFTGHLIARWEGALFLGYFLAYMTYRGLVSMSSEVSGVFAVVMLSFVVPLTVITLALAVMRSWRATPSPDGR